MESKSAWAKKTSSVNFEFSLYSLLTLDTDFVIPSVQNPNLFIADLKLLFNLNIKLTT
jgi:hypothetical protein